MQQMMEKFPNKALQRFLNENEIKYVKNYKTAAGFWAAKEAFTKALGVGISKECGFHDIEIYKSERGAPLLKVAPHVQETFHIASTSLSITHDGEYAIAVVAIEIK